MIIYDKQIMNTKYMQLALDPICFSLVPISDDKQDDTK